jgi:hypothetical protein
MTRFTDMTSPLLFAATEFSRDKSEIGYIVSAGYNDLSL